MGSHHQITSTTIMKDIKALVSILAVCLTVDGHPAQLGGAVGPGVGVSTLHKSVTQAAPQVHHIDHGHGHGRGHGGHVHGGGHSVGHGHTIGHRVGGHRGHGGHSGHGHHISHGSVGSSIGSSIGSVGLHSSVGSSIGHGSIGSISSHGPVETVSSSYLPVEHVGHVSHDVGHSSGGHGYDEYEKPDPFQFEYGVHDDHYHTDFSEHRSGDEAGNIYGEYQVALPDGRIQYVDYKADGHYGGTVMEVRYEGEARHPEYVGYVEHVEPIIHDVVPSYHIY